jgi:hypothetical protein
VRDLVRDAATTFLRLERSGIACDDIIDDEARAVAMHHADRAREVTAADDRSWHRERAAVAIAEGTPVDVLAGLVLDEIERRIDTTDRARRTTPARRATTADALFLWRREVASGRRSRTTLDALWRAAASQAAARDALPGTPSEAALVERCNAALAAWAADRRRAA